MKLNYLHKHITNLEALLIGNTLNLAQYEFGVGPFVSKPSSHG